MSAERRIRIWDLPTRLFHWALALSVLGLVITGSMGGDLMIWHFRLGYGVMVLLLFRLVWGFVGGKWSRFSSFSYSPATVLAYLKGQGKPEHAAGHSPLGAAAVFALLSVLALQVASGLVSDDQITNQGPLTRFVSGASSELAHRWHQGAGKWIILALLALHIGAIAFYLLKKKTNLIAPMLHGDKAPIEGVVPSQDTTASRLLALVLLLVCAALVYWVQTLGDAG